MATLKGVVRCATLYVKVKLCLQCERLLMWVWFGIICSKGELTILYLLWLFNI